MSRRRAALVIAALLLAAVAFVFTHLWRQPWDIRAASTNLGVVTLADDVLARRGISRSVIGLVEMPTGRVVVTDPLVQPDRGQLTRQVPPGRYPVQVYETQGRIAMAALRIGAASPERWELAVVEGQDMAALARDAYFGFPVDSGLGSVMDASTFALIAERERQERAKPGSGNFNYYDNVLHHELSSDGADRLLHRPLPDRPGNVAIFSSGWGDGVYPAIWGLDREGNPVVLVIDFHVLENGQVPASAGGN